MIAFLVLALLPSWATSIPNPPPAPGLTLCSAPAEPSRALTQCPSGTKCSLLDVSDCLVCHCPTDCEYGMPANATCSVASAEIKCDGNRTFEVNFRCQYCFQSRRGQDYSCEDNYECNAVAGSVSDRHYTANCTMSDSDMLCLGRREFFRREKCNWTDGIKWTTALALSITLGGFGADRFYLGHWQEGIGKLFSFGGLGVWTLVDVVIVAIRYVGPADGSLYISP